MSIYSIIIPSSVGDDNFSADDIEMAGKVSVFARSEGELSLIYEEAGLARSNSLGASAAFVQMKVDGETAEFLAVGQPASDSTSDPQHQQTGSVLLRDLSGSNYSVSLSGNLEAGRFGLRLSPAWDGGLLVSAPYAGLGLRNHGKVYYYSGSRDLPSGDVTSECQSSPSPCTEEWASLVLLTRTCTGYSTICINN